MEWIAFPLVGLVISVLSGFFGVGGGFILTPFLLLIGFSPVEAIMVSLLFSIATSVLGAFAHLRQKNIRWKVSLILGVSGVLATQVAQPFVMFLSNRGLDEVVIPLLYIILLLYFAWKMKQETKREVAATTENERKDQEIKNVLAKTIFIGIAGGFVSTTLGVGGGFLMVPLLITLLGFQARQAVGTSLMSVLFIVVAGFITYALETPFDFSNALFLIVGALVGSPIGAKLTKYYLHQETAKWLSYLYIAIMGSVVLKLFQVPLWGLGVMAVFISLFTVNIVKKIVSKRKRMVSNS